VVVVLLCLEPPKFKTLFKMSTGDGYCCLGGIHMDGLDAATFVISLLWRIITDSEQRS
jgi:hypothetical protein